MSLTLLSLSSPGPGLTPGDPVRLTRLEFITPLSPSPLLFLWAACFSLAMATFSTSSSSTWKVRMSVVEA